MNFFFFTSAYPSKQKAEEGFQCLTFEAQWNVGNFDTSNLMEKHCVYYAVTPWLCLENTMYVHITRLNTLQNNPNSQESDRKKKNHII